MVLAALLTAGLASAEVRFERAPEKVEEEELGDIPYENEGERRKWIADAAERAGLASLDAAVRWRAEAIDACVRAAGASAPVTAKIDVSVGVDGATKVRAKSGADTPLATCVTKALGDQQLPLVVASDVRGKYTVSWSPEAAPAPTAPALEPAPEPAATTAPEATAKSAAFAPRLDEERGFANLAWGDPVDLLERAEAQNAQRGTTFYARSSDSVGRWLGAKLEGAVYAVGADGLHSVVLVVQGTTTAWRLREALTARYGPPEWDSRFGAYFWRGERVLLQLRPTPGSEEVRITLLDIDRARASGLADRMPGDPVDPTKLDGGRRLPRIFQDKPEE